MKSVDVPMWDKGDSTDNYAKGGSARPMQGSLFNGNSKRDREIRGIYEVILGREPSTRELSYHRFGSLSTDELIEALLNGEEHKKLIEKGHKYPELEKMGKLLEGTILKLRTAIEDKESEINELNNLLNEKNSTIEELRGSKDVPYITDKKLLETENTSVSTSYYSNLSKPVNKEYSLWEKVLELFFGRNE